MRWTGPFLIVLALLSLGCARRDWISETLTLVDVTGTWEGPFGFVGAYGAKLGGEQTIRLILKQSGAKVKGEVQGLDGASMASIEGTVNGDVFSWQMIGPFTKVGFERNPAIRSYSGETPVNGDEMQGVANGYFCPCTFVLRRVGTQPIKEKQQM
jgi:hypothetical protein